jgi:methionyl-tRNA formyltransferase
MKIICLANNWTGWQVVKGLKERGEQIVGLVVHPEGKARFRDEILEAAGLGDGQVFDGSRLRDPAVLEQIAALEPDLGLSLFFAYIMRPEFLEIFPREVINLHPGYLPYNRGVYANVFSILDDAPAGVTLHYVDQGVDTGDIIARLPVLVEPDDTGKTLYRRLEKACLELFWETWPQVSSGTNPRTPQDPAEGSAHSFGDIEGLDLIDLDKAYTGRELINLLRARTFPPYRGAYFLHKGQKVYLRLELEKE